MTGLQTLDATALADGLEGRVVGPGDADYDELRAGFNGMIDKRPAAMILVASETDVAACIAFARVNDLPLAIRGGGHSAPGFGCCDDGIVIDVRELKDAEVDPEARTIRCGAGLTWKEFDAATQAHGLAVTGGRVSTTGVAGLTIGSGSGWLERAMGLTSDSLIGARVVTAEGDVVVAGPEDPELLWALRGGGGNFGVITEFTFALKPLGPEILGGVRMYRFEESARIMREYRDIMLEAPPELCGGIAFLHAPPAPFVPPEVRGKVVMGMFVVWAGAPEDGPEGIAPLDALGTPVVDRVMHQPYTDIQQIMDPGAPWGKRDYFKGGFITELTDEAVDDIVGIGGDMRAPLTQVVCVPLGETSAYAAVGEELSAIGHRSEGWSFQVLSLWDSAEEDEMQKNWTRATADTMSSYSEMVSYPNFLAADEPAGVTDAYTPATLRRLRAVKDRLDPGNVFRINHNIAPTALADAA